MILLLSIFVILRNEVIEIIKRLYHIKDDRIAEKTNAALTQQPKSALLDQLKPER